MCGATESKDSDTLQLILGATNYSFPFLCYICSHFPWTFLNSDSLRGHVSPNVLPGVAVFVASCAVGLVPPPCSYWHRVERADKDGAPAPERRRPWLPGHLRSAAPPPWSGQAVLMTLAPTQKERVPNVVFNSVSEGPGQENGAETSQDVEMDGESAENAGIICSQGLNYTVSPAGD